MKIIMILVIFYFVSTLVSQFNPKEIMETIMSIWVFILPVFIGLVAESLLTDEERK